ncbi:MAG: alpha-amylase family glycosyl hydrolase [Actinomycetota bacterium]
MPGPTTDHPWWREGVLYQIYVRSFADSDGDGIGDLGGVIDHLDHLEWLGVDGLWLSPITPSPNRDWGYDVADYREVAPELGDLETLARLVAEARARGIRILLDLVPNHTSDVHPWFVDARTAPDSARRDRYVWADPRPDGSPPNNWESTFGDSAWELDASTGQYYLHNFLPEQPDLNWWSEDVRREFDDILRFWFDRGIDGFRIDVAHGLIKDRGLRDNPPMLEPDPWEVLPRTQQFVYNMHRPEVHEVFRDWRRIADAFDPPRVLVGETWVYDLQRLSTYYGAEDELHLCFNFAFVHAGLDAGALRANVEASEVALAPRAHPVWTASNHDITRFPSRWCDGRRDAIRCVLMALLTLRGTPFLYYGDEIGMPNVAIPPDELRDPVALRVSPEAGRDPGRTPMQWTGGAGAGFTSPGVRPWLPFGDAATCNVADQRADPDSTLNLCRDLIALRRRTADLRAGAYASLPSPPDVWSWRRGDGIVIAVNLSDAPARLAVDDGTVLISTDRRRDGEAVREFLELSAWQGVVLASGSPGDREGSPPGRGDPS